MERSMVLSFSVDEVKLVEIILQFLPHSPSGAVFSHLNGHPPRPFLDPLPYLSESG